MCGIGLILTGARIAGHFAPGEASGSLFEDLTKGAETTHPKYEDLCKALARRGPDHLGGQILYVDPRCQSLQKLEVIKVPSPAVEALQIRDGSSCVPVYNSNDSLEARSSTGAETSDGLQESWLSRFEGSARLEFIGATLQLRGGHSVQQPQIDSMGNVLIFNGEVFGGLTVRPSENDTEVIMKALLSCCTCFCHSNESTGCECAESIHPHQTVLEVLSRLRGPWALIYWQAVSRTLWFGRDAIGRRSLLIHKPTPEDQRFLLTSVAPEIMRDESTPGELSRYWEELTCGIYSIIFQVSSGGESGEQTSEAAVPDYQAETACKPNDQRLTGWSQEHRWHDPLLNTLLAWERDSVNPTKAEKVAGQGRASSHETPTSCVLAALCQAVKRRTETIRKHSSPSRPVDLEAPSTKSDSRLEQNTPVAILFSGGLDSMILAAIATQYVDVNASIDLLNVSFEGDLAPDRITAVSGLAELEEVFPSRRWRLIKIDAKLSDLACYREHLLSLICPSNTYMDINIGTALWLAASGKGYLHQTPSRDSLGENLSLPKVIDRKVDTQATQNAVSEAERTGRNSSERRLVQSGARVLLVGSGADEQCGGYGRHRTKFRQGGWETLDAEMKLDVNRIWKRNLGRDDRCLSDHGKEARFPFLDEDVVATLLSLPLWDVVNMEEPAGFGDKKILRQVARLLGLKGASTLPKRAIQFGSRIARESNRRDFGSNRAANLANAGTVVLKDFVEE